MIKYEKDGKVDTAKTREGLHGNEAYFRNFIDESKDRVIIDRELDCSLEGRIMDEQEVRFVNGYGARN